VRSADSLRTGSYASGVTDRAPHSPRLAYGIQEFADATCLSYETVRQAILRNELVARYVGRKAVILHEEGRAWLQSLPDRPQPSRVPITRADPRDL
jgi:hypothetical protein